MDGEEQLIIHLLDLVQLQELLVLVVMLFSHLVVVVEEEEFLELQEQVVTVVPES